LAATPDSPGAPSRRLPRGRHGLSRAFVEQNQRERIFASLAAVCAVKGYPASTVEDVTVHAGVSRRTFYDLFRDKEDCFLAAYDAIGERLITEAQAAYLADEPDWPRRIKAALQAVIDLFAADPAMARLVIVEVLGAGRRALEHRDAALARFAMFFEAGAAVLPAGMQGQELLAQGVIGGLYEALCTYIRDSQADRLPELFPDLLYCTLVPYLGHPAAMTVSDGRYGRQP
jgi:AcrR family transcriptional regulator